jgi:hypothetical protein
VRPVLLVWIRGLRGPTAEIWRDNLEVYRSRSAEQVLAFHELADAEAHEPLDRLARKYPVDREPDD